MWFCGGEEKVSGRWEVVGGGGEGFYGGQEIIQVGKRKVGWWEVGIEGQGGEGGVGKEMVVKGVCGFFCF